MTSLPVSWEMDQLGSNSRLTLHVTSTGGQIFSTSTISGQMVWEKRFDVLPVENNRINLTIFGLDIYTVSDYQT